MSTFGTLLRTTTFGESHCTGVGCIIENLPPRMSLTPQDIQPQLTRRRPGQSSLTTSRNENDSVTILSGTEHNLTLGTPIALLVHNKDQRPKDYNSMSDIPRPSHADYTYQSKYGIRASSGGGRSSARETIGRVAAGAIAEKFLNEKYNTTIIAYVSAIGDLIASKEFENQNLTREIIDQNAIRCPDTLIAEKMTQLISTIKTQNDSIGGIITCIITNPPLGIGEPVFDKLEAKLAHAMLSIPATKGFEIGSGFEGAKMRGSQHNDLFIASKTNDSTQKVKLRTLTNRSGGVQGGITNGERIIFRVAFKPPATISQHQNSCDFNGNEAILKAEGRHDPCVVPRAVPIVEAMAALVLADAALIQEARKAVSENYEIVGRARQLEKQIQGQPAEHIVAQRYANNSS